MYFYFLLMKYVSTSGTVAKTITGQQLKIISGIQVGKPVKQTKVLLLGISLP
jgi:hypothetical protein